MPPTTELPTWCQCLRARSTPILVGHDPEALRRHRPISRNRRGDARGILRTEQRIALIKDVEVLAAGFNHRKPEKGPLLNRDVDNVPAGFHSRQSPASGLLKRHLAWRSAYSRGG